MTRDQVQKGSYAGEADAVIEPNDYGTLQEEAAPIKEPAKLMKRAIKYRSAKIDISGGGLGVLEASFSYIKGSLSSGFVTIPLSFVLLGFIPSLILGMLISAANYFTMFELDLIATDINANKLNYSQLVKQILGKKLSYATKILQFLYCFGAALAELVFTIRFVTDIACFFHWKSICEEATYQYAIILFVITPLLMITKMYQLSYASLVASIIQISFYVFVILYLLYDLTTDQFTRSQLMNAVTTSNISAIFEVFGVLMYTISNATNPIEVRRSLSKTSNYSKVLKIGCSVTAMVGLLLGCMGPILNEKKRLNEIILMELPNNDTLILSMELLFVMSIAVNFLVFGFGIFEPLEQITAIRALIIHQRSKEVEFFKRYMLRLCFVGIIFFLSIAIPNLTILVSLVGSLNAGLLILVFPAIMILKHYEGMTNKKEVRTIAHLILLVGTFFTVAGTVTSLQKIIFPSI